MNVQDPGCEFPRRGPIAVCNGIGPSLCRALEESAPYPVTDSRFTHEIDTQRSGSTALTFAIQHQLGSFVAGPGRSSSPNTRRMRCHRPCLTHSSWRRYAVSLQINER
jgi:hypothetical protein